MKKPTLGQLNTLLLVMYVIFIPILLVFVRYALNYEKSWVNDHDQEIIEYDTKVIECETIPGSARRLYHYIVKLEFPDGKKMTYKSEHKEEGIKKVYEITYNGKSYYGFSKVALYSQIHPFYSNLALFIAVLLWFGPFALYAYLRNLYGYYFKRRRKHA